MKRVIHALAVLAAGALLFSCAGMAEKAKSPAVIEGGTAPKDTAAPKTEPEAKADLGSAAAGEAEVGDGEFGEGDVGNGDVGDGEEYFGKGDFGDGVEEPVGGDEAGARAGIMKEESGEWVASAPSEAPKSAAKARAGEPPSASGLKAGFADDNKQYGYFVQFLSEYGPQAVHLPIAIEERIILKVQDSRGKSLPNASVTIFDDKNRQLARGLTYADGSFLFFPSEHGQEARYRAVVTFNQVSREASFERAGRREVPLAFDFKRPEPSAIPLDILFILDTTGSMGEEIQRLKTTIEIINLNLSSLSSRPQVRFGMVLYKDRGDQYVTDVVPFTGDLDRFQAFLDGVEADGGGDTPEDLQAALQDAMKMSWNRGGIRLAFIITDAPPHLDYGQAYNYVDAVNDARSAGIKIFGVGTGGLDLSGEIVLRQIAQYTGAKYIFLTYGEQGESEGGKPGSVSHHTGANYQTDKLEAIIIRFAKEELAFASDLPLEQEEEYFQATKIGDEEREETLGKLFTMAVSQLIDYSTYRIPSETTASVLPLAPANRELAPSAEYFTEQLLLSFHREQGFRKTFRILERQDLQKILDELELQLSGLTEDKDAARVGQLLGAKVLVTGRLYAKESGYELFLKLLRVETGEILSVTKALIDRRLGV